MKPKICFILGIGHRSGTNFVFRLLWNHPHCVGTGPIWEDFSINHSDKLVSYADAVALSWATRQKVDELSPGKPELLKQLGSAVQDFLLEQLAIRPKDKPKAEGGMADCTDASIMLTKTPSAHGVENYFDLFPGSRLIFIVRDGRAVVESAVRSFGISYTKAAQRWRRGAETILDFMENNRHLEDRYILVKYEDLVLDTTAELRRIFDYLDLNAELYDFHAAKSMGVIGSSDLKTQGTDVHWNLVAKKSDFNPLARFKDWDKRRHEDFNLIAGDQMIRLGYELDHSNGSPSLARFRLIVHQAAESSRNLGRSVARRFKKR